MRSSLFILFFRRVNSNENPFERPCQIEDQNLRQNSANKSYYAGRQGRIASSCGVHTFSAPTHHNRTNTTKETGEPTNKTQHTLTHGSAPSLVSSLFFVSFKTHQARNKNDIHTYDSPASSIILWLNLVPFHLNWSEAFSYNSKE